MSPSSRNSRDDYPNLCNFFVFQFNEDWMEEYNSVEDSIDDFSGDEPLDFIHKVVLEIIHILKKETKDLNKQVHALGCRYYFERDYVDGVDWLLFVLERLLRGLWARGSSDASLSL